MTSFFYRFYKTLPIAGLFFLAIVMAPMSYAALLSYNDPTCDSFELQNNGNGSFTLICKYDGDASNRPSNCSVTLSTPAVLGKTGGTATLSGSCAINVDGLTAYKWIRVRSDDGTSNTYDGVTGLSQTLPANTGSTNIVYTYTMYACNGTDGADCSYPISRTVTVLTTEAPVDPPSGCSVSGTSSLSNAGGSVALTGSCSVNASGAVYSWTRSPSGSSYPNGTTLSDNLPSNGGALASTYTYIMTACNGDKCASTSWPVTVAGTTVALPSWSSISTSPASMVASGGTVTLTASCSNAAGATYTWKRNEVEITGNGSSTTNSIGANTATTAVTYTYAVQACVAGVGCSSEITKAYTQDGVGGGGVDYCPSTGVTRVTLPWAGSVKGDAGASGILVAAFTVPLGLTTKYATINISEYQSTAITRLVSVSPNACGFSSAQGALLAPQHVMYFSEYFTTTGVTGYPKLEGGKTYYVNLRNQNANGGTTCSSGACQVLISMGILK
jgi:hypothetical protein